MKRLSTILIVVCLCVVSLFGCGSEELTSASEQETSIVSEEKEEITNPFLEEQRKWYPQIEEEIESLRNSLKSPGSLSVSSIIVRIIDSGAYSPTIYVEFSSETGAGVQKTMYAESYPDSGRGGYFLYTDENPSKVSDTPSTSYANNYKIINGRNENYNDEGHGVFTAKNKNGNTLTVFELNIEDYCNEGFMYLK